ncbi:uncharacterized protein EAE97_009819 [Botrytis byssoidea]|uniref:Uncharacterized protein n=1 Tax=Botrytis byssoidea TaxID=139641 RepID=A0A9P5LPN6_9HELO|nr:uncharacterized protein EAE97_009819 [Botrytis byssoidea]KAF7928021.1 hypothetical protein EAE97_009819 [Botrytis byssoidea]
MTKLQADEDDSAIGARVVLSKLPIFRIGLLRYDAFHVSTFSARYDVYVAEPAFSSLCLTPATRYPLW